MKIAVNAMPSSGYGGITYLRHILPVLDRRDDGHEWFVYGRRTTLDRIRFGARKIHFREVAPKGGVVGRLLAEQAGLPVRMRADGIEIVYTANNPDLFFAPRPRVIAIRYTEPFLYRQFYNSFSKQLRCAALRWLTSVSLRTADHILCVSDYARRVAGAGRPPLAGKTSVVHHGLGEPFRPGRPAPAWGEGGFLFASAKMIGYSNLHTLAEAYAICRRRGLTEPLLVAGGPHDARYERNLKSRVAELGLAGSMRFLGYVDPETMAGAMGHASVFIFSSLLEACPNTLIEAMGCGAAIVASDTEPNREVAGDAVHWCDGRSAEAMADAILDVARSKLLGAALRERALQQAARFSWDRTAERLVEVLERVRQRSREEIREPAAVEARLLPGARSAD
jgi:glycosyltransferase involved in cell wall biosynthesis